MVDKEEKPARNASHSDAGGEEKKESKKARAQEDGKQGDSVRGNVDQREMVTELKESYIDYAMSVIVAR
ncbi:MAG: hypothetical protein NT094_00885, partial [Candidatus Staskawiczbacteria bacterium]|nr:hypothetical protein [Candidatus Staskawiczbacteria bacterium]